MKERERKYTLTIHISTLADVEYKLNAFRCFYFLVINLLLDSRSTYLVT